jgi:DNA-binding beta-propeller fold protein YncE
MSVALFVTNVLNGTVAANGKVVHRGTILRLKLRLYPIGPPKLVRSTKIASGYTQRTDPTAFVLGPTGLGFGRHGRLYVAETLTSRIFAIPNALTRTTSTGPGILVSKGRHLNMPLGLAIAPNGNVLTVNGGDGRIVETTPAGAQIFSRFLNTTGSPAGAGALFGLAVRPGWSGVYFVDDDVNTLRLLH